MCLPFTSVLLVLCNMCWPLRGLESPKSQQQRETLATIQHTEHLSDLMGSWYPFLKENLFAQQLGNKSIFSYYLLALNLKTGNGIASAWTLRRHLRVGLDTNIPKYALKIHPEIPVFSPKNPSKNLSISLNILKLSKNLYPPIFFYGTSAHPLRKENGLHILKENGTIFLQNHLKIPHKSLFFLKTPNFLQIHWCSKNLKKKSRFLCPDLSQITRRTMFLS